VTSRLFEDIEGVAFDLDGTLVDTAPDLAVAANRMLAILGGRPLPEARISALIGAGIDQLVAGVLTLSSDGSAPKAAQLSTAARLFRDLYEQRLFRRSRLYPGARETLTALQSSGIFSCCITNKERRFTQPLLEAAGIADLIAFALCAERAEERKPHPTLLLAGCQRLGVAPARMLYVGDSRSDIVAARAAGCRVVVVDYGYHGNLSLADARPDGIIGKLPEIMLLPFRNSKLCAAHAPDGPS
jgi:phosphoglycolate phosphatase